MSTALVLVFIGLLLIAMLVAPIIKQKMYLDELRRSATACFFWFIVALVIAGIIGWSSFPFVLALGTMKVFFAGCYILIALFAFAGWAHLMSRHPQLF